MIYLYFLDKIASNMLENGILQVLTNLFNGHFGYRHKCRQHIDLCVIVVACLRQLIKSSMLH